MGWSACLVGFVSAAACVSAPAAFAFTCPLNVDGWSPNGRYIAVTRLYLPSVGSDVGIVNADGRSLRLVSHSSPSGAGGGVDPVWSPDSRSLVYLRSAGPGTKAYRRNRTAVIGYDLVSGRTRVLGVGNDPSYGPHGLTYIASGGVVVAGRLLVRGSYRAAAWSPSGSRLGLERESTTGGNDQLVITDARGKHPRVLVRNAPVSGLPGTRAFAWSPDGRRLAYLGSTTLYIANADGSESHSVTDEVTDFAWSPNSQLIALIGYGFVATVAADGTGLSVIPGLHAGQDRGVYWSPDSARIAVAPAIVDVATRDVVRLPVPVDITLMWSPDGSMLVDGDAYGSGGLYLIGGDGSTYTHIDSCQP